MAIFTRYVLHVLGIFIIAHACDMTMKKYQKKLIIIIHSSIDPNHQVKLFQFCLRHYIVADVRKHQTSALAFCYLQVVWNNALEDGTL